MPFAAKSHGDNNLSLKNSKKNSSTLQNMQATDFCVNTTDYSRNIIDAFPGSKQYSKILRAIKAFSLGRASLSTHLYGVITVEASIALPIYIFILSSLIYMFNILYIENTFQERLSEISREISSDYYISCSVSSLSSEQKELYTECIEQSDYDTDSTLSSIPSSIITTAYIHKLFNTDFISRLINSSNIIGKYNGLSFEGTYLDSSNNDLFISLSYKVKLPFLPSELSLPIKQYCKIHLFIGKPITKNKGENITYVYCSFSGNIYHTNKYCSYLTKYTSVVPISDTSCLGVLACYRCNYPSYSKNAKYVYLTETGDCYHYSLDCPVFTRHIYKVRYSDLDSFYKLCTRCQEIIK